MTFQNSQPSGAAATERLPLVRPEAGAGRYVGGVCAGLAAHLGLPVQRVRLMAIAAALCGGAGVIAYLFLWITVPVGDAEKVMRQLADPHRVRTVAPPVEASDEVGKQPWYRGISVSDLVLGFLLVLVALAVANRSITTALGQWLLPALVILTGALLTWSQLDERRRGKILAETGGRTPWSTVRMVGGVVLVVVGVLVFVGRGTDTATAISAAVAAIAVLTGVAIVLAPWWLRLIKDLAQERAMRERADERAEIAAHLHDSVLQTLAMIQRSSTDSVTVSRLARTQERELRQWLYEDSPEHGTSLAAEIRELAVDIDEQYGVPIDVVVVGDAVPDDVTGALVQATNEALKNAVRHGRPPISLYLEASERRLDVSVRDRGDGFDLDSIAEDRFGVRESIIGRITRRGGTVDVRQIPDGGTEIRIRMEFPGDDENENS
ncbi:phage shock protein C (PspC) family protein [Micrococcales bacterium KH10]|nr:phage shock protein C (PspC) family protein [Micrococcales bacterium KH10]